MTEPLDLTAALVGRHVVVDGVGAVAHEVTSTLRRLGARVHSGAWAAEAWELGAWDGGAWQGGAWQGEAQEPRAAEVARVAGARAAPATSGHAGRGASHARSLAAVVLVGHAPPHPDSGLTWHRAGVPILPVVTDPLWCTVGPLVVPGVSSCLRCHELVRLGIEVGRVRRAGRRVEALTAPRATPPALGRDLLLASLVSLVLSSVAVGSRRLAGISVDVDVAGPTIEHRHWARHPLCGCGLGRPSPRCEGGHAHDTMAG